MESPAKILIVDDDSRVREVFCVGLQRRGYVVRGVAHPREALRVWADFDADLVVTDMLMPGANGAALVHQLRSQGIAVKILLVTGGGEQSIEACVALGSSYGVDAALHKPVRIEVLDRRIRELLA